MRAKGNARRTRSDWMKIEQDRGISVATSVMTFERGGLVFNLLDTPGHEDFSEDTYRTLTAVDAAVMVLDAAKGIEAQTRKLFEVCRLRNIPIITFINKMDREARDPFELIDEIEKTLALDAAPVAWPVGRAADFAGTWDMLAHRFLPVDADDAHSVPLEGGLDDPRLDALVGPERAAALREEAPLAEAACPALRRQAQFREGHLTPVFFGSALRDFGVGHLLDGLARHAPPPHARGADARPVAPGEDRLTGFVFKVQANMDPNHRDRVAFVRLCSGRLVKGMRLKQVRTGKQVPVNAPLFFFAKERQVAEEAWPGDVVGVANHGTLRIGDTLDGGRGAELPRRALLRARDPADRPPRRPDGGEEAPHRARAARRGGGGAALPPARRLAAGGGRGRAAPARRAGEPAARGIRRPRRLRRLHVDGGALGGAGRGAVFRTRRAARRWSASPPPTAATRARTTTARWWRSSRRDWRRNRAEEEWPMLRFHAVREQHGLEEVRR